MTQNAKSAAAALEGLWIVDLAGRLLASDAAASTPSGETDAPRFLQEIAGRQEVEAALARIAAGEPAAIIDHGPTKIRLQRLAGPSGVFALVSVAPEAQVESHDALTGLADRRAIPGRLGQWRRAAAGRPCSYAVLFLDLDDFKRINDEHGHAVGDQVLIAVAQRLVQCVREGDLVVRYGGDEFVLLLRGVESADAVEPVVERLRHCLSEPIEAGQLALRVGASVGIAIGGFDAATVEAAIDAADRDMYARKRRRPR